MMSTTRVSAAAHTPNQVALIRVGGGDVGEEAAMPSLSTAGPVGLTIRSPMRYAGLAGTSGVRCRRFRDNSIVRVFGA